MNDLAAALAGRVRLSPGRPLPTIHSSRRELAARVAIGRRAGELPALLGALFTLCSHAHQFTAQRAVAAALGRPAPVPAGDLFALQLATAREQVLRIAHDWPRQLPGADPSADSALLLRSCPLWRDELSHADRMAALPAWLEHRWLGMGLGDWLAHWSDEGETWVQRWCQGTDLGPVARVLRRQCADARDAVTPSRALNLLSDPQATLPLLARQMAQRPGFCSEPTWLDQPAETGPWTRAFDPRPRPAHNAWMRLISRVVDVLRLAAPGGERWLAHGALPLGAGSGIAWAEMARGLLVHWVQLEPSADGARVVDCRVLAPTEWNFHPRGVLAQSLAALRGEHADAQARRLAVAFDPCVEFDVQPDAATGRPERTEDHPCMS